MTRISVEEKNREAADWFSGLIGIALVLAALIIGYYIYINTAQGIAQSNNQTEKVGVANTNTSS